MGDTVKVIYASVFRDASGYDYSNGGLSSEWREVAVEVEGGIETERAKLRAPLVRVVHRSLFGGRTKTVHVEPAEYPSGMVGPMAGGAYVASSDARFRDAVGVPLGAVALFDRFETPEQYDRLSR